MDWTTVTIIVMVAMPLLYIIYDVIMAATGQHTYSSLLRKWGRKNVALTIVMSFGVGLLLGHWFWCPSCEEQCQAQQLNSVPEQ